MRKDLTWPQAVTLSHLAPEYLDYTKTPPEFSTARDIYSFGKLLCLTLFSLYNSEIQIYFKCMYKYI